MNKFLLITNIYKDKDLGLAGKLKSYIETRGGSCGCLASTGEEAADQAPLAGRVPEGTECVIVLGGDGTLIRAASALVDSRLPLIGVNLGTLGYLCELEEDSVFDAIDQLMAGTFMIEERMMLSGHGFKDGIQTCPKIALNDIVLIRTGALSVVNLIVYVNGEYLNTFCADGIILSTPTGSTGYNMSAGGPIVDPKAEMILITPINEHNLSARSIVVGAEDEIVVEIGKRRFQRDEKVQANFDGDMALELGVGERFCIHRAKDTARILKLNRKSFLEILSKKMRENA